MSGALIPWAHFSILTALSTFSLLLTMSPNRLKLFLLGRIISMLSSNSSKSPSLHVLDFLVLSLAMTDCNKAFKHLLKKNGITHKIAHPYHPQTSGQKFSIVTSSKFLTKWLVPVGRIGPCASLTFSVPTKLSLKLQLGCHCIF